MPRGLLDPESQAIEEAAAAAPRVPAALGALARGFYESNIEPLLSPVQTARGLLAAGKQFVRDPSGTAKAVAQAEGERLRQAGERPESAFEYYGGLLSPFSMLRRAPTMSELDVYHGTPHRFPATEANPLGEFDASKIGTGEGAQAYGHGIYFAESPSVAKAYQNPNAGSMFLGSRGINVSGKTYSSSGQLRKARDEATDMTEKAMYDILATAQSKGIDGPGKIAKAIKDNPVAWGSWEFGKDTIDAAMKRIREETSFSSQKGSFYKADLPDEMIDRMLDWDKPLSQQSDYVKKVFGYTEPELPKNLKAVETGQQNPAWKYSVEGFPAAPTEEKAIANALESMRSSQRFMGERGEKLYQQIAEKFVSAKNPLAYQEASEELRRMGIPGIKYADAGSRGKGGTGTRNFVVFPGEEKKVRILERK